ncbi:unnamed protein product [Rhizoctonia solani]|uniref:Uncharacterized protein n=1 Tax=Rhizoctonia solani TaxID=456999 RepID=A0A8H3HME7_9AGAM|nr:unnamed protein product [Rhizoctonia solani]
MMQAQGAYGLPTSALVGLALMQSIVQGVLIPMLTTFLTNKSDHQLWFKIYVVFVNVLTLGQTIIHIIQAFDVINAFGERVVLAAAAPVLTGLIGASVQAFFAYRCWRIYRQRILAIIPLLFLWLVSFVSAVAIGAFLVQSIGRRPDNATVETYTSTRIWVVSSLLFDLVTTSSTIAYLYRVRKGFNGNKSTLVVVWNVIWASAAPPFVLIIITLVDGPIIAGGPSVIGTVAAAMSAKFFVLSIMINLVGQEWIRRQFEPSYPSPPGNLQSSRSQIDRSSKPVAGLAAHITDIELLSITNPTVVDTSDGDSGKYHSENVSVKSIAKQHEDLSHTIHDIRLNT